MPETLELGSTIRRVDVYRTGAIVFRSATLACSTPSTDVSVRFSGLPLLLEDASVRIGFSGAARARVLDLRVEFDLGAPQGLLLTPGEEELRKARRREQELQVLTDRLRDQIAILESVNPSRHPVSELPERLAFEPFPIVGSSLRWAASVRETMLALRREQQRAEGELRKVQDDIARAADALSRESTSLKAMLSAVRKAVLARFRVESRIETLDIELSYQLPGARWVPQYEVRVDADTEAAEIAIGALVAQRTGEDWPRVALSLSSADISRSCALAEPDSWRIGRSQDSRTTGWRPLPENLDELFEGYDSQVCNPPTARTWIPVTVLDMPNLGVTADGSFRPTPDSVPPSPQRQPLPAQEEPRVHKRAEPRSPMPPPPQSCKPLSRPSAPPLSGEAVPGRTLALSMEAPPEETGDTFCASAAFSRDEPVSRGSEPDRVEKSETRLIVGAEALDFNRLRMVMATEGEARGRLKAEAPEETLVRRLAERFPSLHRLLGAMPRDALRELFEPALPELELPVRSRPVEESAGHFAVRYTAESPVEVAGDGEFHRMVLSRRQGEVRKVFRCVPRLDPQVYRIALFGNPLEIPLLAGPVAVFHEGDFVVTAMLDTTPPGKPITLNLGVEPGIVTARNTRFRETTEGLLGGDTVLRHDIEVEVRSKLRKTVTVEVFERVPVSQEDDVKIELDESDPKAEPYDQADRGKLIRGGWRQTLALGPGETRKCTLTYRITIPAKSMLKGGNRRD